MNPNYPNGQPPNNPYGQRSSFNQVPLPGQQGFQNQPRHPSFGYPPQNQMMQPGFQRQGTMGRPMGQPMMPNTGHPMMRPMGQPMMPNMGQPMGQPMMQPMGQPMGYSPMGSNIRQPMGYPNMAPQMGGPMASNMNMRSPQMSGLHMYLKNIIGNPHF